MNKCLGHKLWFTPWLACNLFNLFKLFYVFYMVSYLSSVPACSIPAWISPFILSWVYLCEWLPLLTSCASDLLYIPGWISAPLTVSQDALSSCQRSTSYFLPQLIEHRLFFFYWQVILIRDALYRVTCRFISSSLYPLLPLLMLYLLIWIWGYACIF